MEFPVNVLMWPPLQLLTEDPAPSARVNLADYIRDDPKSGNHTDDWGYIFNEKTYAGCDRKTQEKLVEHIQLSCNEQGFSMTVHTWANKEERGTLRIRLKCSHNRRTKCKFSFQLCYGLTEACWYLRRGSGKHIHSGHLLDQNKILLSGILTTQQKRDPQAQAIEGERSVPPVSISSEKRSASPFDRLPSGTIKKKAMVHPTQNRGVPYCFPEGSQPPLGIPDYTYQGAAGAHHEYPVIGPGDPTASRNQNYPYHPLGADGWRSFDDHSMLAQRDHSLLNLSAHSIDEREAAESLLFAGGGVRSPPRSPLPNAVSENPEHERHPSRDLYGISKNPGHERNLSHDPRSVSTNPVHERHMSDSSYSSSGNTGLDRPVTEKYLARISKFHAANSQFRLDREDEGMEVRFRRDQYSANERDQRSVKYSLEPPPPRGSHYPIESRISVFSRQTTLPASHMSSLPTDTGPVNRSVMLEEGLSGYGSKKEDLSSAANILESSSALHVTRSPKKQQQSEESGINVAHSGQPASELGGDIYTGFSEHRPAPQEPAYSDATGTGRCNVHEYNGQHQVGGRLAEHKLEPRQDSLQYRGSLETRRDDSTPGSFHSDRTQENQYTSDLNRGDCQRETRRNEHPAHNSHTLHYSAGLSEGMLDYTRDDRVRIRGMTEPHYDRQYEAIGHAGEHYAPAPARSPSESRRDDRLPEHGDHQIRSQDAQYGYGLLRGSPQPGDGDTHREGAALDRRVDHQNMSRSGVLTDHTSCSRRMSASRDKLSKGSFFSSVDTFAFSSVESSFNDDLDKLEGFGRPASMDAVGSKKGHEDNKDPPTKQDSKKGHEDNIEMSTKLPSNKDIHTRTAEV